MTAVLETERLSPNQLQVEFGFHANSWRKWVHARQLPALVSPGGRIKIARADALELLTSSHRAPVDQPLT